MCLHPELLQLRVLRLGLLQNGEIRVSIFPQREEILVGRFGLTRQRKLGKGTMYQRT